MSAFLWHVIVDPTANRLGILDEDNSDLYRVRFNWSYRKRGQGIDWKDNHFAFWGRSRGMAGDDAALWPIGQDAGECGLFEPTQIVSGGTYRPWFIRGQCTDGSGNPLAACNVECYISGSDLFQAKGITDQNGYYELPVQYGPGTNFTVYANYAGGTYVGASVDTVQSAL